METCALGNGLLAGLPPDEDARLARRLTTAELRAGQILHEPAQPVRRLYFPLDCVVTLVHVTHEGQLTEIAVVGNEGMVGVAAYLGGLASPSRAIVHSAGRACVAESDFALREFGSGTRFRARLLLFIQALMTQIAQTALCNRHHSVDQQLSRWLLLSFDRVRSEELYLTQEIIADMLGVRRVGITEAARRLREKRVIRYRRGRITLLDRAALESGACECYRVIRAEYRRLLGADQVSSTPTTKILSS